MLRHVPLGRLQAEHPAAAHDASDVAEWFIAPWREVVVVVGRESAAGVRVVGACRVPARAPCDWPPA